MGLLGNGKKTSVKKMSKFEKNLLTEDSPFAVQEAYKTLRTNIMFSIPGDNCKKIIITSAMQGESKSTTAVNLSIAFAQNHSKVLLIDCDLRLPTVAQKLGKKQAPGLSNILVGMNCIRESIHRLPNGLDILPAGDIPPNPTELLGSEPMRQVIEILEKEYEYIILDTPPVCMVADAVILSKLTSGVVVTVRQNVADQETVNEALQKLKFAESKILGFVFTGVENEKQKSYRKGGYYGYGYGYGSVPTLKNTPSKTKKAE